MSKKIIFGGILFLTLAGAAFTIVGVMGVPERKLPPRGSDEYYTSPLLQYELAEINVNLKDKGGSQYLQVVMTVQYVIGEEIEGENASSVFVEKTAKIEDKLNLLLSDKTYEEVNGKDDKELIKEEIRRILQQVVFPDKMGRIEEVLFRKFYTQ